MQPFYKGNKTHPINLNDNSKLERMTGTSSILRKKKTEVLNENFQDIKNNMSFVNGAPNTLSTQKQRYEASNSMLKTNQLPFNQVRVGPGLNQGYTTKGSGGFHQANTRDFTNFKTVDELRTANNPKLTYEGRIISGQKGENRGLVAKHSKNRVSRVFKNSQDRYLKTGGGLRAAKLRENVFAKPTKRNHISYNGALKSYNNKHSKYAAVRQSRRKNYMNSSPRNANLKNQWQTNLCNEEV